MVKKKRIGFVVSDKQDKTIVVMTQRRYRHSKYKKVLIQTKRYMVHDEKNICKLGDLVLFEENLPISKYKAWILCQILKIYLE